MMLSKSADGEKIIFEMGMTQHECANINFCNAFETILQTDCTSKLIFIDPIVLAKQKRFLEIEMQDPRITLVPTNIHEGSKNLDSVIEVLTVMENRGIGRRNELICAIGGGSLMDTVSFAASVYRRGVRVTKVPSTLLGVVDAAIGIKTGVNFMGQRNRLGSYHFGFDVLVDTNLLDGNTKDVLRQGLGEIFKIATIKGSKLFQDLLINVGSLQEVEFYKKPSGISILSDAILLMLEELHSNPREENLQRSVDFGHSFCPLVEMESLKRPGSRKIPHGYAVAYDCVLTTAVSRVRKLISQSEFDKIFGLYSHFDFDFRNELYKDTQLMWASFLEMTKHRAQNQNLPVPTAVGEFTFIQDLTYDEMVAANRITQKYIAI